MCIYPLYSVCWANERPGADARLTRMSNDDCLYLDRKSRLCTIYDKRPDTCRNHPKIGPRPGYCAYKPKVATR